MRFSPTACTFSDSASRTRTRSLPSPETHYGAVTSRSVFVAVLRLCFSKPANSHFIGSANSERVLVGAGFADENRRERSSRPMCRRISRSPRGVSVTQPARFLSKSNPRVSSSAVLMDNRRPHGAHTSRGLALRAFLAAGTRFDFSRTAGRRSVRTFYRSEHKKRLTVGLTLQFL